MNKKLFILVSLSFLFLINGIKAEEKKQYQITCVAFYNLENLFDTLDTPDVRDTEFTPSGSKLWTGKRYWEKLDNMAKVIASMGEEHLKTGPAVIGVSEIENRMVLEDLVKTDRLKALNYGIVHYDSPDRRGIDVALLYQKDKFTPSSSNSYELTIEGNPDFRSRDQLLVSGDLMGERIHVIVNHWPSRSGGEKRSRPLRNAAADLSRAIVDSIQKTENNAKIFIMGDLNDDPVDPSLKEHLKAKADSKDLAVNDLYNPMEKIFNAGNGSLAYRDAWSLFDQIVISQPLVDKDFSDWTYYKTKIYRPHYIVQQDGRFKGYPLRTYVGNNYKAGYSDHFPVYHFLIREVK